MYTPEQIEETFKNVCRNIEEGDSLRTALKNNNNLSSQTFYKWIESDISKSKQYACACEVRADKEFEDILSIADNVGGDMVTLPDGTEAIDHAVVARDKLRVDARKWRLSKMNPKKYSDKLQLDTSDFSEQPLFPDV